MKTFRIHYHPCCSAYKKHPVATITARSAEAALEQFRKAHWGASIIMIFEVVD